MRLNLLLLILTVVASVCAYGQSDEQLLLKIGDPAPPLQAREWLKGTPIPEFWQGTVYVLEYWATWCKPCRLAMPRLSATAAKYQNKVVILGIDLVSQETVPMQKIKGFVDSMGHRINYHMATQDKKMAAAWIKASGEEANGIPKTFVIDGNGKLAWIGHPMYLDTVLPKIINNEWDVKKALASYLRNRRLKYLDREASFDLAPYRADFMKPGDLGRPDSALAFIHQLLAKEPGLKYTPVIASHTFSSLLITDPQGAYEYGKALLQTPSFEEPAYSAITGGVEHYSDKLILSPGIYRLAAEAFQLEIDRFPWPEYLNIARRYRKMADFYRHANDEVMAQAAELKALEEEKKKALSQNAILPMPLN